MFRAGMRLLLSSQPDFEIVGEAVDGEDALAKVQLSQTAGVVLMDLRMPVLDGAAATRRLKATHPEVRVLVLTTFDEDATIFDGLRAGAIGYLLKDAPTDKLYRGHPRRGARGVVPAALGRRARGGRICPPGRSGSPGVQGLDRTALPARG